ncbi:hypothetical protein L6R52_41400 [Myxococcota bacterium]|nr:hypothetical protein [Myxococcota bacterium]
MKIAVEIPSSLRGLPAPWGRRLPLIAARRSLTPTESNLRTALDVAARGLEESLRAPPTGDYSGFPEIYRDDMIPPWNPIDVAIDELDDFSFEAAEAALSSREPITREQAQVVVWDWLRGRIFEIADSALIWIGESRDNQPNAPELPALYALCDRYLERATPDLGVELLSTIWDIAREGAHPRLLAAAANPNLSDRVRQKAEFLYGLSLEDPNELKEFILSGEPALPQDCEPRE